MTCDAFSVIAKAECPAAVSIALMLCEFMGLDLIWTAVIKNEN